MIDLIILSIIFSIDDIPLGMGVRKCSVRNLSIFGGSIWILVSISGICSEILSATFSENIVNLIAGTILLLMGLYSLLPENPNQLNLTFDLEAIKFITLGAVSSIDDIVVGFALSTKGIPWWYWSILITLSNIICFAIGFLMSKKVTSIIPEWIYNIIAAAIYFYLALQYFL